MNKIYEFGKQTNNKWFVNVLSISEGFSYFVTNDESVKLVLAGLFNVEFDGDVAQASRLWLRKEMFKHDTEIGRKR
jgi:hypothetical protein